MLCYALADVVFSDHCTSSQVFISFQDDVLCLALEFVQYVFLQFCDISGVECFLLETTVLSAISNRFNTTSIALGALDMLFDTDLKHDIGAGCHHVVFHSCIVFISFDSSDESLCVYFLNPNAVFWSQTKQ